MKKEDLASTLCRHQSDETCGGKGLQSSHSDSHVRANKQAGALLEGSMTCEGADG